MVVGPFVVGLAVVVGAVVGAGVVVAFLVVAGLGVGVGVVVGFLVVVGAAVVVIVTALRYEAAAVAGAVRVHAVLT